MAMISALTPLQRKTIAMLDEGVEQIALLPSVISRISALDLDAPGSTDEIVSIIRSDPTLALRLMRLANSPAVGGREVSIRYRMRFTR